MSNPKTSFAEFYPFYLSEHANRTSRYLHFTGTTISVVLLATAIATERWWLIPIAVVQAYAFAWVGHFFFEHNKPASFKQPVYSFMGDWRMWWEMWQGKHR
jgi:hypothetical protein